ncbi:MAG: GNAT family N-acetyltransferase [Treponema sp.]|jgi:Leu/Phe-tRNA-protein transferase|nr:GNAT family N-acetyltransferase [Treponema sp.]
MWLRFTNTGHILISPGDNCRKVIDVMLLTDYNEDFCVTFDLSPDFTAKLMEAGFLVMSMKLHEPDEKPFYVSIPKLHFDRSALFFENLHIKKSIRRFLKLYELRPDTEFEQIIDRCVEKHGNDWLTEPLVDTIKQIRASALNGNPGLSTEAKNRFPEARAYPTSFALYRDGKLAAGEFGVVCGRVYTSYSGFYDEDNAGAVQLILTTQYLQEQGFLFFDLGMPMSYKDDLGAVNIEADEFVRLFRLANSF